ncbi:hypothetical protein ACWD0J_21155 [Streptomyces sp. NPDC003011]
MSTSEPRSAETEQGAWHTVWLYTDWRSVTGPMTPEQREYAAGCVAAYAQLLAGRDAPKSPALTGLRWWREERTG